MDTFLIVDLCFLGKHLSDCFVTLVMHGFLGVGSSRSARRRVKLIDNEAYVLGSSSLAIMAKTCEI